jgi:putative FmdB family regulatory protein
MPTYLYKCPSCEGTADVAHSMLEEVLVTCPNCDVAMVKKPINAAISFSGGWMANR